MHRDFSAVGSRAGNVAEFEVVHDVGDTMHGASRRGGIATMFWRSVASCGAMVRSPADLGYDASAYALPPLNVHQHTVETEHNRAHGLLRWKRRRSWNGATLAALRWLSGCAHIQMVNADRQPWVVWRGPERRRRRTHDRHRWRDADCTADDADVKEQRLHDFAHGKIRCGQQAVDLRLSASTGSTAPVWPSSA